MINPFLITFKPRYEKLNYSSIEI